MLFILFMEFLIMTLTYQRDNNKGWGMIKSIINICLFAVSYLPTIVYLI